MHTDKTCVHVKSEVISHPYNTYVGMYVYIKYEYRMYVHLYVHVYRKLSEKQILERDRHCQIY